MGLYIDRESPTYWRFTFKLPGQKQVKGKTKYAIQLEGRNSAANKKLAQGVYEQARQEALTNKHLNIPKKILLRDLVELWLTTKSKEDQNIEAYRSILKPVLAYFKDRFAQEITRAEIKVYRGWRRDQKIINAAGAFVRFISGSTVNKEMAYLGAAYNSALEDERVSENPCAKIPKFNEKEKRRVRYLNDSEKDTLLSHMTLPLLDKIVRWALMTGMRRGEILNLKWSSVDLIRGIVTVEESKGGSKRWLSINEQMNEFLMGMPRYCQYVFEQNGERVKERSVSQAFKRHVGRVGISNMHFHDLRHTYASDLLAQKRTLSEVQYLLGHASPVMTQRYAHLSDEMKRDAMNSLKPLPVYPKLIPWQMPGHVIDVKMYDNEASAVSSVG